MKHRTELPRLMDPCGRALLLGARDPQWVDTMMTAKKDFHLLAVHLIEDERNSLESYKEFAHRMAAHSRVTPYFRDLPGMRGLIPGARLHFIYLEDLHWMDPTRYRQFMDCAWYMLRGGGILAGSGFHPLYASVMTAVLDFGKDSGLRVRRTWGDEEPSWYFIK